VREKAKERRSGWRVALAGLGGFVLGAATVLLLLWGYGGRLGGPPAPAPAVPPGAAAPAPTVPAPAAPVPHPGPGPEPAAPSSVPMPPDPDLARRNLLLPVQGARAGDLRDTFAESRAAGRPHEALDILAPRNTPVLAVEDGKVAKLFTSDRGGLTVYHFDPTETYAYYYAHLERYAGGLAEGAAVRRGQVLGYVGTSGNAPPNAPHLHFAIFRLTPEKHWWQGAAIDPYPLFAGR
jgi:peptidoglycan LD-endopeptidase LytH